MSGEAEDGAAGAEAGEGDAGVDRLPTGSGCEPCVEACLEGEVNRGPLVSGIELIKSKVKGWSVRSDIMWGGFLLFRKAKPRSEKGKIKNSKFRKLARFEK